MLSFLAAKGKRGKQSVNPLSGSAKNYLMRVPTTQQGYGIQAFPKENWPIRGAECIKGCLGRWHPRVCAFLPLHGRHLFCGAPCRATGRKRAGGSAWCKLLQAPCIDSFSKVFTGPPQNERNKDKYGKNEFLSNLNLLDFRDHVLLTISVFKGSSNSLKKHWSSLS